MPGSGIRRRLAVFGLAAVLCGPGTLLYVTLLRRDPFEDGFSWITLGICAVTMVRYSITRCGHCRRLLLFNGYFFNPLSKRCLNCGREY